MVVGLGVTRSPNHATSGDEMKKGGKFVGQAVRRVAVGQRQQVG